MLDLKHLNLNSGGVPTVKKRTGSRSRRRTQAQVTACISECKYEVVKEAAIRCGWRLIDTSSSSGPEQKANIHWVDISNINDRLRELLPWQRINHFPGMSNIARKARMAQCLDRMRRQFPADYGFYPRTWVLPAELTSFRSEFDAQGKSSRMYIIKPDAGCQGKGIYLTQELDDRLQGMESQVAQLYVRRPLLIDGFKFDLRVYVLVTSLRPLRVYVYSDGLARFCTSEYVKPNQSNMGDRCMHLTNYAINRHSEHFVHNEDAEDDGTGSKRSLRWLLSWIKQERGEKQAAQLWSRIGSCVVKTLAPVLPQLHREYRNTFGAEVYESHSPSYYKSAKPATGEAETGLPPVEGSRCIEILGFDFMVDEGLKPWLIEVNHLPSFATDSPLDMGIKSKVIQTALSCLKAKPTDRASYEAAIKRDAQARLYPQQRTELAPKDLEEESNKSGAASADVEEIQRCLVELYERHAPWKVSKIGALLRKYAGREKRLLQLARSKYENNGESGEEGAEEEADGDIEVEDTASLGGGRTEGVTRRSLDLNRTQSEGAMNLPLSAGIGDPLQADQLQRPHTEEASAVPNTSVPSPSNSVTRGSRGDASGDGARRSQGPPPLPSLNGSSSVPGDSRDKESETPLMVWAEPQDKDALDEEKSLLEGWERLWPAPSAPSTPSNEAKDDEPEGETEVEGSENLSITVPVGKRRRRLVAEMIQYAFEEDNKQYMRLLQPPAHQRSNSLDEAGNPRQLRDEYGAGPGAYSLPDTWRRGSGGGGLVMGKPPPKRSEKLLPVPGLRQQACAQRLSRGLRSGSSSPNLTESEPQINAPSNGGGGSVGGGVKSHEWLHRRSEGAARRYSQVSALKVHTYQFGMDLQSINDP